MTGTNYNVVYPDPLWAPSAIKYCGLEAWVYSPSTGVNMTLYVGDAFDHYWVKSPGSIDVMINPYRYLAQSPVVTDKNLVLKDVQWAFTGRRRLDYAFKARGGG
jgi:hypothetical protein